MNSEQGRADETPTWKATANYFGKSKCEKEVGI